MSIITEEMRYRQKLCEFDKKYGVTLTYPFIIFDKKASILKIFS